MLGHSEPTVAVFNGPNLNLLAERDPKQYGGASLADVEQLCRGEAGLVGFGVDFRQTNHEGVLIDWLHEVRHDAVGVVLNAGGYTHTSVALRDAIPLVTGPVVEVHISDILHREDFRAVSMISDVCDHRVIGRGVAGYGEAVSWIATAHARRNHR